MVYKIIADVILIIHFLYVIFAVGGEIFIIFGSFKKWNIVRKLSFRITHLISVVIVAIEASLGILCPLTLWENQFRILSGQKIEEDITFIGRIFRKIMFYDLPLWIFTFVYILFSLAVVITFIKIPPKIEKS